MGTFFCEPCKITFEDNQGLKKEYKDYIYGPCWKYIAYCPECKQESSEKRVPKPGKSKQETPPAACAKGGCQGMSCMNSF